MNRNDDVAKRLRLDDFPPVEQKAAVGTNVFRVKAEKLERALQGIASCATQCPCCEMHRQVAEKALGYPVAITTDRIE